MREPSAESPLFGLLAEFDDPEKLVESIRSARKGGYRSFDAYSPFPIDGLGEAMDFREIRVPLLCLFGGLTGTALGIGLQYYTNWDYPIDVGGRPLFPIPAFMLITVELAVLFAVGFAILGMLVLNHLPRLHHPLFDVKAFDLATSDKFFLVIFSNDDRFDERRTRRFLVGLEPLRVEIVGHTEEPE